MGAAISGPLAFNRPAVSQRFRHRPAAGLLRKHDDLCQWGKTIALLPQYQYPYSGVLLVYPKVASPSTKKLTCASVII